MQGHLFQESLYLLFFGTSYILFGQVHYGNLLVPGQVSDFAIPHP